MKSTIITLFSIGLAFSQADQQFVSFDLGGKGNGTSFDVKYGQLTEVYLKDYSQGFSLQIGGVTGVDIEEITLISGGATFTTTVNDYFIAGTTIENSHTNFLFNYEIEKAVSEKVFINGTAGLGFSTITSTLSVPGFGSEDANDTVFAYQLEVGVGYALTDALTLDAALGYFGSSAGEFEVEGTNVSIETEALSGALYSLGLTYRF